MNRLIPRGEPLLTGLTAGCLYPDCSNHKKGAKRYCCNGCSMDHADTIEAQDPDAVLTCTTFGKGGSVTHRILDKIVEIEEPVVIDEKFVEMSETWFLRHHTGGWGVPYADRQSWLVLFNGAFLSTDYDSRPRYDVEKLDKGDYRIVDTDYLPVHYSETKYLQIARTHDKKIADLLVRALRAQQTKPTRRKNG